MAFITENFLLNSTYSQILYHEYAAAEPVFDYHCHLPIREIAEDAAFRNATHLWLGNDHYKWRLLRLAGVPEDEITGAADDYRKFTRWASVVSQAIGNPLLHWTQLELKRYFDIDLMLSADTADSIWHAMNEQIADVSFTARNLIQRSNVYALCTTDDPTDDLRYHTALRRDPSFTPIIAPAFRPDAAVRVERREFGAWLAKLSQAADVTISDFTSYLQALRARMDAFHAAGCRIADYSMEVCTFSESTHEEAEKCFTAVLKDQQLSAAQLLAFRSYMLIWFGREYAEREWTMQLHIGAHRNVNTGGFIRLGPDTGFDAIQDDSLAAPLAGILDALDRDDRLPRTILYALNPKDYEVLAALAGSFHGDHIAAKVQLGSGWWFNDHLEGMRRQMKTVASMGLLSSFVGMLTDSRSFISYPRHEYFRRILCQLIGSWVEAGELPWDEKHLGTIVLDICFHNAKRYFRLPN